MIYLFKMVIFYSHVSLPERKWAAVDAGEVDEADRYSDLIKRRVKQDKEEHVLEQLETITSQGYKWDGLKRLRNQFTPAFTKFKDADGNHVPFKNYPQKDAEYLHDVQWKPSSADSFPSRLHIPLQNGRYKVDDSPFSITELDSVLSCLKRNRTPGDDGIPAELYKWLSTENRLLLLKDLKAASPTVSKPVPWITSFSMRLWFQSTRKVIHLLSQITDPSHYCPAVI